MVKMVLGATEMRAERTRGMPLSDEMRKLRKRWQTQTGWPRRLSWLELHGLRGWSGDRIQFDFPLTAVVGQNGSGKSTILQAAACVYQGDARRTTKFPQEFFPDTAWDSIGDVDIKFGYRQAGDNPSGSLRHRKRWLGHRQRPLREVRYVDLRRIQPVSARVGYAKIAKTKHKEDSATPFDEAQVKRLSAVMAKPYQSAKMALSDVDPRRAIPVLTKDNTPFSGFHQGSGETTVMELLQRDMPKYGIVLIDEIESSLHPRVQRNLVRDLAEICREKELQIIMSTHSPYILEELPMEARIQIMETGGMKTVVRGVSPQFAMSNMDDQIYPEIELFVEDLRAQAMLAELLAKHGSEVFVRSTIIPFGSASVGLALGQMLAAGRYPRPAVVFLDGDSNAGPGVSLLPGGDAPEQVVFKALKQRQWGSLWVRVSREISWVADACARAMTQDDHHHWVGAAATELRCSGDTLWQAMCAEWAEKISPDVARPIVDAIAELLP